MGARPSSARYKGLLDALAAVESASAQGEIDRLRASFKSLKAVLRFLQDDPEVVEKGTARSLGTLFHAINDTLNGAKPKLLFDRPPVKGAPKNLSKATMRAQVILAVEWLLKSGLTRSEAGAWLASELLENDIDESSGKPITGSMILRWRSEKRGKSLSGSDLAYDILKPVETRHDWPNESHTARRRARGLIKTLKASGF